jgi:glutaminase
MKQNPINYQSILQQIHDACAERYREGKVATYIPELASIDPKHYGLFLLTVNEEEYGVGDFAINFSIQSISKVLSLAYIFSIKGEAIWERIGMEPSGNPFNSIVQLEYEKGIPRNPFINAGALVMADMILTEVPNAEDEFLAYVRQLVDHQQIHYNRKVAQSEWETGNVNKATIYMLKHHGNIKNDIEAVLRFYFLQCSIEMSCRDLAKAFLAFANRGVPFHFNNTILSMSQVKRINAIMQTCGFYDEAGEFSFRVGLPGKSGVGGGIVAVHPERYSVAVWSPPLNQKGNSVVGLHSLEMLTTLTGLSIF